MSTFDCRQNQNIFLLQLFCFPKITDLRNIMVSRFFKLNLKIPDQYVPHQQWHNRWMAHEIFDVCQEYI